MSLSFIKPALEKQKSNNLYRRRVPLTQGTGRELIIGNERYINFSSNDYLGLSNHPDLKKAFAEGVGLYGTGSGSSSLVTGYSKAHLALEEALCDWLGGEAALLFSSGFSANSGCLSAMADSKDTQFILDKLAHASLIDGALNSVATTKRYKHNDIDHLNQRLQSASAKDTMIVTEGVFSMDGDKGHLDQIYTASKLSNSQLYVDDAHGIGVLGENGSGTLSSFGISDKSNIIQMATFGKALGTQGACIVASDDIIEYLVNRCRDYIYSTAISPAVAHATIASIHIAKQESWRREKLNKLSKLFKLKLDSTIETTQSDSAIIGVITGSETSALYCQQHLKKLGSWVAAIRPPTVERGKSRLRVTLSCEHNENDINNLANSINEVLGECLKNN